MKITSDAISVVVKVWPFVRSSRAQGMSYKQIALAMNKREVLPPRDHGLFWTSGAVRAAFNAGSALEALSGGPLAEDMPQPVVYDAKAIGRLRVNDPPPGKR
jgi:hypothetical protein